MKINLTPNLFSSDWLIKFSCRSLFSLFFFFSTVFVFANEIESSADNISSEHFLDFDKVKSKKNQNKSLSSKKGYKNDLIFTVNSIDLNGPMPGVNNEVLVNSPSLLYPMAVFNNQINTTTGTATSARITFSSNTNGVPAGVPNPANEQLYAYDAAGTTLLGTYQISTTSATTYDIVVGTNTLRISHATANVFDITEVFGQPILVDNLEILIRNQYYYHSNPAIGDTRRYAVISVTDPDTTLSAYARLSTGSDPVAVNDTNAVAANSPTPVTGNLLTNDTDATVGDTRTITEVHGYTSSVGAGYTSTYGTITVQSNGTYSYNVDVDNATVKGLKNGNSISDIISYQVTDNVGNFDFGYLTVTINGVTEPPVATNNTNNVTVGTSAVATGNVISDDSGLGTDRLDRNTSLFVWESQYTSGATVNGTTRTVGGVNVSFVQDTPVGVGAAGNQTVNFGTNGGHTGYFLFASDVILNGVKGDNKLTINFSKPVANISFALSDIDFSQTNVWQDQMRVLGSLAGANANYNKQVAGSIIQTGSDTFYGTGSVPANDAHGNVTISFNSPIDKLEFSYNYGPNVTAPDPGQQIAGLTDLVWQDDEASGVLLVDGLTTNVGVPVTGTYGTFIIYANGSYTYTLNSSNPAILALTSGQTLTDSIPYSISDNIPGSGNTANANLIITIIGSRNLVATNDNFSEVGGSVLSNDTIDGTLVTTSNTDVIPVSTPQLSIDSDGNLTVLAGTTAGTYSINYTICETAAIPANCKTATATVIVSDNDSDGVYDSADLDDDNDGILDSDECSSNERVLNGILTDEGGSDGDRAIVNNWTISNGTVYVDPTGVELNSNNATQSFSQNITNFFTDINGQKIINVNFITKTGMPIANSDAIQVFIRYANVDYARIETVRETTATAAATATITYLNGASGNVGPNIPHDNRTAPAEQIQNLQLIVPNTAPSNGQLSFFLDALATLPGNVNNNVNDDDFLIQSVSINACVDTDGDGLPNQQDLDSDNDGCSDSNEYYSNATSAASGQQFGQTGGAIAPVLANGIVNLPAATYTGSYSNVTSVGTSSSITSQPFNRIINAGTNTTFSVIATGGSGVTQYQWQVDSGSGFTNISNNAVYSDVSTNVLTLTSAPSTFSGYKYRVIIGESNFVCSNLVSNERTLTVYPAPNVTIADASIAEGGNLSFVVSLSNPAATDITVTLGFTNVTTVNGDYTTTPVTVTFLAGATTATATAPTIEDGIYENDETFTVAIASTTGPVGSTTDTATGTIVDNDDAPTVTGITASSATEGDAIVFEFVLSNPSAVDTTYTFTLTNGTAGDLDYTTTDVTVTVPAGATTGTVSVPTTQDAIDEADETFTINNGAVSATGTIVDNDNAPTVTGIAPASATEGDAIVFEFVLSNPSAVDTTYTFTLTNGTAGDLDYTTTDVTVTVPAGATTGTVSVPTTQDTIDEADETFTINNGAVSATGTIEDNDNAPTVTEITASSATEGDAIVFEFTLSNPSAVDTTYTFTLTNGTAGDLDYTTTDVTVIVPAGATTGTVSVPTNQDTIDELDETFTINNGAVSATGTIVDNDNAPTVTGIAPASATEGSPVVFDFTLSNPSAVATTYTFTLTNGTAGDLDYTTTDVTVTVPAGATTGTVSVPTTQDTIDEADETFTINNGAVSATGTIEDNDNAPTVTEITASSATEGDAIVFEFTLSNPSAVATTYTFTLTNGTAGDLDYTTTNVTVTVPAGATTGTVSVPTTQDAIDEADETLTINNGAVSATGTIEDNDNAPTVIGIAPASATEGSPVVFDFTLSNPSAVATTYTFTLTNGTAGDLDYTTTDVTVIVPAGATTGTVSVPTTQDAIDESDETFTINNGAVSATGTIVDNDNAPTVTGIAPASAIEGSPVVFDFTLSNPSAVATTYTFTLINGTAGDLDYTTTDVTVTVPAGATTGTVSVPTTQDAIDEADETFTINNGAVSATGTIVDNDNAPTVTEITASSATEGDAIVFEFTLSNPSAVATTYTFTLTNGTAGDLDYTTTDVTVTVPAGATTGTVSVPTTQDTIDEADETFTINNGAVSATGTIVDNDVAPVANDDTATTDEDTPITINVTANDTDVDGTIDPATVDLDPSTAGIQTIFTVAGEGTYAVNNAGEVTFTPILNYNGTTTPINYTVKDNLGLVSNAATLTITVTAVIDSLVANNDTFPSTGGNVLGNDTVNNKPAITTNIVITPVVSGPLSIDANGNLTVAQNTSSGTYTIVYEICQPGMIPANCISAKVTVVVNNLIVANNIIFSATGGNVTANDTVNGAPATTFNTDVTPVSSGPLSIDANGILTVTPNTPSGTYGIEYEICEVGAIPSNCRRAIATVVVSNSLVANSDTIPATGGNVLSNDTINGAPATTSNTDVTPVSSGPLSIDAEGNLTVAPNTVAGTYTIAYQICEIGSNPLICTTSQATVVVDEVPKIAIVKTAVFNDENGDGFAVAGETITYNFSITNMGNVALSNVTVTDILPGLILSGDPILLLQIGETNNTAYQGIYRLTQNDINLGSVSNQAEVTGTTPQGIIARDLSDNSTSTDDRPTVLSFKACVIEVFNAVSPNGDGNNDVFRIRGLECYADNTVEIYNRWGVLVFERSGYNNDDRAFRGISEGRVTIKQSEELPVGVYYYILRYKDSTETTFKKAGYLYINK